MMAFTVLAVASVAVAFMPHFGAPDFRYTGSDPDHPVWNLGWPMATCIYDSAHSPHFFIGPFAYVIVFAGLVGFTVLYAVLIAWNHREMLRASTEMEAAH